METTKEQLERDYSNRNILFKTKEIDDKIDYLLSNGYKVYKRIVSRKNNEDIVNEFEVKHIFKSYHHMNFNTSAPGGIGLFIKNKDNHTYYFGLDAKVAGKSYVILQELKN